MYAKSYTYRPVKKKACFGIGALSQWALTGKLTKAHQVRKMGARFVFIQRDINLELGFSLDYLGLGIK